MKKLLTALLFSFLTLVMTITADAQYSAGAGIIYGTEIEQLGIRAEGFYTINEEFRVGASLGYYFPDDFNIGSRRWFDVDLNAHYFFYAEDQVSIYGLGGLNIAFLSINFDDMPNQSDSEVGLNLGAGVEYLLDFGSLFGELQLSGVGGDADQLVLGAGVRFGL